MALLMYLKQCLELHDNKKKLLYESVPARPYPIPHQSFAFITELCNSSRASTHPYLQGNLLRGIAVVRDGLGDEVGADSGAVPCGEATGDVLQIMGSGRES